MSLNIVFQRQDNGISFTSHDRLLLGEGLFETVKVLHGEPCYAKLHWQRLSYAAKFLRIPFYLSLNDWLANLSLYIKAVNLKNGGIKAVLSGGSAPRGLNAIGQTPYLFLEAFNYIPNDAPIILTKAPWLRDSNNPIYRVKSINYLEAIMAYRYAQEKGAEDALFFSLDNFALETTIANIFLIINEQLITPPLSCNILPGITRGRILKICKKLKKTCFERQVTITMLAQAEALFICNTLQAIRPVKAFDEFSYCEKHPLVEKLRQLLT
ncbi:aminodeoxychorismate lyase [Legionella beliardensis]|uniref:Aminodeoxychorismate lyase n=1 Tax=Legionella beliardensis TaxID=91822 RepID=A0A378HZ00_9GAMM|nr:aminotransferase class IV [Legionella beliardensis]STX28139.1 aminodeoxychorismate lyase [Legionella beliardensis]